MRKRGIFAAALLAALALAGCASQASVETPWARPAEASETPETPSNSPESGLVGTFTIVDGAENGVLTLAGEGDVYTLSVENVPVTLDGEAADASALEDGMHIAIAYERSLETYPCQLAGVSGVQAYSVGSQEEPGGGYFDLCGLYLRVLDDLWNKDAGLNGDARYVSVDLSEAPGGLTDAEKAAVAWVFADAHDAVPLTLTYTELMEEGYLTDDGGPGYWEDGVLFSIDVILETDVGGNYSLPTIRFNAQKWRSGLGAYFLMDCSAVWPETGTWTTYTVGDEAIS